MVGDEGEDGVVAGLLAGLVAGDEDGEVFFFHQGADVTLQPRNGRLAAWRM